MKFETYPIISTMLSLYEQPRTVERFKEYIKTLQGTTKNDLAVPISGFNPMAKEHVSQKLKELQSLKAEEILTKTLSEINNDIKTVDGNTIFKVMLNLADDKMGGWTNRYTTDYDSKFKLNAFIKRGFCTPYFWTSELYSKEIITTRIEEYVYRTLFWIENGKVKTLEDHIHQERYVAKKTNYISTEFDKKEVVFLKKYYEKYKNSEDYNIIFNFMYGDAVCKTLAYPTFGIKTLTGTDFAKL